MSASHPADTVKADLLPLDGWLAANSIDALSYLTALLDGRAPAPIQFAGNLYVYKQDITSFRDNLRATAFTRLAALSSGARDV